jgi:hypothetical protein
MKHVWKERRGTVRKRIQKTSRVYEMFMEIGNEKINKIKKTCVSVVTKLTDREREKIITHFTKNDRRINEIEGERENSMEE